MRNLKSALAAAGCLVLLVIGCEVSPPHEFSNSNAGTTAAGGNDAAGKQTTEGGSTPVETGGSATAGKAPAELGGAGGEAPVAECAAGDQESCWEQEDGTPLPGEMPSAEFGSCHIGKRFCSPELTWGPCLGAVAPKKADSCDIPGNDDDCDTIPNEGCNCVDGTKRDCGSDVGSCKKGQQTCVAQAWGPCVGEVTKLTLDSCVTVGNDDNCNGKPNEDCPCVGNAKEDCGGCGSHDCNPAARQWGACHAAKPADCPSATQVRDCSPEGNWVTTNCMNACVDGSCAGSCVPGTTRCVAGPERRQTCSDQGAWTTVETCAGNKLCQDNGGSCVAPCAGQKLCPGNVCAPLGGCCSDADCGNNFACINGTCSTTTCQSGFNGPCGGTCTKGCCSVNDCPDHPNMGRSCNGSHQCLYSCKSNWGNCDGSDANGCEVNLVQGTTSGTTVKDCGMCGNTCNFANQSGLSECKTLYNVCEQAECRAVFKPLGDQTDEFAFKCPVDRPRAALRYGDCGNGCLYDCTPGYVDCNYSASDGCETPSGSASGDCYADPFWGGIYQ
ncbi:MAG TPA: hypothetical protein VHP33_39760 [Polyangiaceae bacterium]|nr:hypothetical protein [Polyangiaceae bacterium]